MASSFNFTKAAEMRAAAMQRQSAASPASTPVRGLQPGIKSGTEPPGRAAKAGAQLPAQPGGSMSGDALPSVSPTDSIQGAAGGAGPSQAAGGSAGVLPIAPQLCRYARCPSRYRTGRCRGLNFLYVWDASSAISDGRARESRYSCYCKRTCGGAGDDKHGNRCKITCYPYSLTLAAAA